MKLIKIIFFLCALCVSAVTLGPAEDWTSLGRDQARTRSTPEKLSQSLTQTWQYPGTSDIVSSPAIADGVVVFGTKDRYVRALRESDGTPLWSFLTGDKVYASPGVANGKVYIPSTDGKVYCLRLTSGDLVWNYATGGTEFSSPLVVGNVLFMGSGFPNSKVLAINALTKDVIWNQGVEQIVYSSPACAGNKIFIGCDSGRYYALDQNNGDEIWSYNTGGAVLFSSPLVSLGDPPDGEAGSVYLLPGGIDTNCYRVDIDSAKWGTDNWQVGLSDPSPPGGAILSTKLATSSPMKSGSLVVFVVRFDFYVDTDADDTADQYVLHEFVIAIDPMTESLKWQEPIGSSITTEQNQIPGLGLCPTPASMQTASGAALVVCSSIASEFKIIDPDNGNPLMTYLLDGACRASPAVANSQVFIATENGSLYAFQCNDNRAPAAVIAGFDPAYHDNVTDSTPTISWSSATDPDAGDLASTLRYLIRVDDDGEILEDADLSITTDPGITSITISTPVPDDTELVYAIRTIDDDLAYSDWSALQTFWVNRNLNPPEPPSNLRAEAGDGYVELFWEASPSQDVRGYLIAYKESGESYGTPLFVGDVTDYLFSGLSNGIEYTFKVVAEDYDYFQSSALEVSAKPAYRVTLNGIPCGTLVSALVHAQPGDTVKLGIATFVVPYTLEIKEGINIQGYSPYHTILDGTGLDRVLQLTAGDGSKGTLANLTIYGAQVGIDTAEYKAKIRNTIIRDCDDGIMASAGSPASPSGGTVDIINNTIINNTNSGLQINSSDPPAGEAGIVIRNNIIMDNKYGVYCEQVLTPTISCNNVYGNTEADYFQCSAGTGDISLDVIFIDEPNQDYRVEIDQPTIDMGDSDDDYLEEPHPHGTRINMGAYGNTLYAATSGAFHITTSVLSDGQTNAYYNVLISTLGGSGPITWTITSGAIPAGLVLNTSTGEISGTIQLGAWGTHNFTAEVVDTLGNIDSRDFSIEVQPAEGNNLQIVTNQLSDGEVRAMYKASLSAVNGYQPYTWSTVDGELPPNTSLNSATGEIIGTPPYGSEGSYSFEVELTDTDLHTVSKSLTIKINVGAASGSSGSGKGKDWCFIATAVYGSPLVPAVKILRRFRDEYLLTNNLGQWLVSQYYRHSLPLAEYIARRPWARITVGIILIPAIAYSWFMVATGMIVKLLCCILIALGGILLLRKRKTRITFTS